MALQGRRPSWSLLMEDADALPGPKLTGHYVYCHYPALFVDNIIITTTVSCPKSLLLFLLSSSAVNIVVINIISADGSGHTSIPR